MTGGQLPVSDTRLRALLNGIFWWSILHIVHEHSVIEHSVIEHSVIEHGVIDPVFNAGYYKFSHETQPICFRFSC